LLHYHDDKKGNVYRQDKTEDVCIVVKMCMTTAIDEDDCAEEDEQEALLPRTNDHEHYSIFSISSASTERSVSAKKI